MHEQTMMDQLRQVFDILWDMYWQHRPAGQVVVYALDTYHLRVRGKEIYDLVGPAGSSVPLGDLPTDQLVKLVLEIPNIIKVSEKAHYDRLAREAKEREQQAKAFEVLAQSLRQLRRAQEVSRDPL